KTTVQEVKDIPLLPQKSIPVAIKSLSVSFVNDDNTRSVFTLPVVGGCLEKTSIKDTYVEYMEKEDVVKYLDLLRKINTLATWEKDMQDFGVEYTKEDLNNTINRRIEAYKEIGMLSVKIKSRVTLSEK
ncbi:MAG TPA: hypothetical protein V6C58_15505, partial [Allocoleopsis sp.]